MDNLSFSILLPVYARKRMWHHGDYFFGRSFAQALERLGHRTKILPNKEWEKTAPDDIAIVIRGRASPSMKLGRLMLEWCISFPPKNDVNDFAHIDHFFAASPLLLKRIVKRAGRSNVSVMYQAFDSEVMFPDDQSYKDDMVFVGTARGADRRPVVSYAAQSGLPVRIWGNGWDATPFSHLQVAGNIENSGLGDIYRSGSVILNDHLATMKRNDLVSNRVYDGLACGRAVLTDSSNGLPPDLLPFVYQYDNAENFRENARKALSETPERRQERQALAYEMKGKHCFDARAAQVCEQVAKMLAAQK